MNLLKSWNRTWMQNSPTRRLQLRNCRPWTQTPGSTSSRCQLGCSVHEWCQAHIGAREALARCRTKGGWGTVVACNRAETIEWAELAIGALENPGDPCGRHPRHFLGAWYPSRSVVVQWDTGRRFMYRAGDGGRYDLAFDVRTVQDFDTIGYLNMLHFVEGALFARCDAATLKHVTTCERAHMCAGLRWLQAGSSVGTVANRLGQMVLWN